MTKIKLERGRVYRAKSPRNCRGFYNDREIKQINGQQIEYVSPGANNGRVQASQFEQWVGDDITTERKRANGWELWPTD